MGVGVEDSVASVFGNSVLAAEARLLSIVVFNKGCGAAQVM